MVCIGIKPYIYPLKPDQMTGRFLFLVFFLAFYSAKAQFIVQSGTKMTSLPTDIVINSAGNVNLGDDNFNLTNANLAIALKGAAILTHSHATRFSIDSLRIDGGNVALQGTWVVSKGITLKNGKLGVNPIAPLNAKLFFTGEEVGSTTGNSNSYIVGPMFTAGTSSSRYYPIGNANGFYPAQLSGVGDAAALLRMECFAVSGTPPIQLTDLTSQFEDIDDLVTDRYYQFNVYSASSFAGSTISLSLNNTQSIIDPSKNKPVVVELDSLLKLSDLQGSLNNLFVQSASNTAPKGGKYMIAASKDVTIKIHRLITPNGDGQNDNLVIEGIDLYPNNKITLLDRWGGVYLTKEGFASSQTDIDYTKLINGNYICIVEYTDSKGTHKPKPQMITVLK
jgi:gliding motility-associated-like protein